MISKYLGETTPKREKAQGFGSGFQRCQYKVDSVHWFLLKVSGRMAGVFAWGHFPYTNQEAERQTEKEAEKSCILQRHNLSGPFPLIRPHAPSRFPLLSTSLLDYIKLIRRDTTCDLSQRQGSHPIQLQIHQWINPLMRSGPPGS